MVTVCRSGEGQGLVGRRIDGAVDEGRGLAERDVRRLDGDRAVAKQVGELHPELAAAHRDVRDLSEHAVRQRRRRLIARIVDRETRPRCRPSGSCRCHPRYRRCRSFRPWRSCLRARPRSFRRCRCLPVPPVPPRCRCRRCPSFRPCPWSRPFRLRPCPSRPSPSRRCRRRRQCGRLRFPARRRSTIRRPSTIRRSTIHRFPGRRRSRKRRPTPEPPLPLPPEPVVPSPVPELEQAPSRAMPPRKQTRRCFIIWADGSCQLSVGVVQSMTA